MQPKHRGLAGRVLNGDDIEKQRTALDVALAEEIVCGAEKDLVLFLGNA